MPNIYRGFPWKWIVTDLGGITMADISQDVGQVSYTETLNTSSEIAADLRPDVFTVNQVVTDFLGNSYPRVAQSNRLVYGFRQEGPPGTAWTIRAAGILMSPQDQGDTDAPLTHFLAYDPWKYLEALPAMDDRGRLPGRRGFRHLTMNALQIIQYYLNNAIAFGQQDGSGGSLPQNVYIDPSPLEHDSFTSDDNIVFEVQSGTSVADVWAQLCGAGLCDIVLTPRYTPTGDQTTNYTHWFSVYKQAGDCLPGTVFAWDTLNNTMGNADRQHSGVPGDFFNTALYHVGADGLPVRINPYVPSAGANVSTYGAYWSQQMQSQQSDYVSGITAVMTAQKTETQETEMAKQGKRTFVINPLPDRSPIPLHDYFLGDFVTVLTSNALRAASTGVQRIQSIPIVIDSNGLETVQGLLCTPSYRVSPCS